VFVPSPAILLSYVVDSSFIYNAIGDVLGLISAILLFDFSFSKLFFLYSNTNNNLDHSPISVPLTPALSFYYYT